MALELESVFSARAKENLKASGENFGKGTKISANPIEIKPIETRKEVAKVVQMSEQAPIEAKATPEVSSKHPKL